MSGDSFKIVWGYGFLLDPARRGVHLNLKPCRGVTNSIYFRPRGSNRHIPLVYMEIAESEKDAIAGYKALIDKEIAGLQSVINKIEQLKEEV